LDPNSDGAGKLVEFGELILELELKLLGVDPLGLGDEDPPAHELDVEPQAIVGSAQLVALADQIGDPGVPVGERRFEQHDPRGSVGGGRARREIRVGHPVSVLILAGRWFR
jgi:hypothetical protein